MEGNPHFLKNSLGRFNETGFRSQLEVGKRLRLHLIYREADRVARSSDLAG